MIKQFWFSHQWYHQYCFRNMVLSCRTKAYIMRIMATMMMMTVTMIRTMMVMTTLEVDQFTPGSLLNVKLILWVPSQQIPCWSLWSSRESLQLYHHFVPSQLNIIIGNCIKSNVFSFVVTQAFATQSPSAVTMLWKWIFVVASCYHSGDVRLTSSIRRNIHWKVREIHL